MLTAMPPSALGGVKASLRPAKPLGSPCRARERSRTSLRASVPVEGIELLDEAGRFLSELDRLG
jgi:hypothetical protein